MKTMAYYSFKWHSRAQVLQAQLFQPLPRTQGNKGAGSKARQIDLSSLCTSGALSPEQDPRLAHSGTQGWAISVNGCSCKWLTQPSAKAHIQLGGKTPILTTAAPAR